MSDNRKYYYLKLKENYFDDDSIVLLESMQDGVLYSNILLKLYLKSLKHGGRLQLDENIPYTAQMIATITRQQIGTVERALQIFLKLGLMEVLDSGTFYMSNIELLIGQSSTEAERKRAARLQNKALSAPRTDGGHLSDIRPPEIEIELEKRDRDKERDREGTPRNGAHRPHLWPLPECFPDGRGTGRLAGQFSHGMGPVQSKSCPSIWLLPASGIKAMPPPSGAGPVRTPGKAPRPPATGITA